MWGGYFPAANADTPVSHSQYKNSIQYHQFWQNSQNLLIQMAIFVKTCYPNRSLSHNWVITASWMFSQSKSYMANFTPMTGKGGTCYRGVQTICQARLETHHWDHQRGMGFDGLILTFQICSCLTSWCHVMMLDIFQKDLMSVHITERLS